MPIFEYRCPGCGARFETLASRADAPPACPRCHAPGVERLPSAFAVVHARPAPAPGPCGSADCACRASQPDD